eukprot:g3582.t1
MAAAGSDAQAEYDNKMSNLNAIFQWSMKQGVEGDGTKQSDFEAMGEERKEFLRKVMEEMTVDPTAELKKAVVSLGKPDSDGVEVVAEKARILEILVEMLENIDVARDLHK